MAYWPSGSEFVLSGLSLSGSGWTKVSLFEREPQNFFSTHTANWFYACSETGSKERSQDFPLTDFDSLSAGNEISEESRKEDFDLPFFDLETIVIATDNFSDANKLGRGGFGPVYKVLLFTVN